MMIDRLPDGGDFGDRFVLGGLGLSPIQSMLSQI